MCSEAVLIFHVALVNSRKVAAIMSAKQVKLPTDVQGNPDPDHGDSFCSSPSVISKVHLSAITTMLLH